MRYGFAVIFNEDETDLVRAGIHAGYILENPCNSGVVMLFHNSNTSSPKNLIGITV